MHSLTSKQCQTRILPHNAFLAVGNPASMETLWREHHPKRRLSICYAGSSYWICSHSHLQSFGLMFVPRLYPQVHLEREYRLVMECPNIIATNRLLQLIWITYLSRQDKQLICQDWNKQRSSSTILRCVHLAFAQISLFLYYPYKSPLVLLRWVWYNTSQMIVIRKYQD